MHDSLTEPVRGLHQTLTLISEDYAMSYEIAIYDWSLFALPSALPISDIEGDTHANDPSSPDYSPSAPSWIGETFTFNGGAPSQIQINDDDSTFEDAYVETGGGQTLAFDITINGTPYYAGSIVENEFSMLDAVGNQVWVVRIDGVNVGFSYPSGEHPTPGQAFTPTVGRDGDPADSGDGVGSAESYSGIVCFAAGALIDTPQGRRRVEELRHGDMVDTLDNGHQPIHWLFRRTICLGDEPNSAKPVLVSASAFSMGIPDIDLVVSQQHRFLVQDTRCNKKTELLVAAKSLTTLPGIRIMNGKKSVQYFHVALENHEILRANGALTESCYIGPMVLRGLSRSQLAEVDAAFPARDLADSCGFGPTARPVLKVQVARRLVRRRQLSFLPHCHWQKESCAA